jgi:hypothetical protein
VSGGRERYRDDGNCCCFRVFKLVTSGRSAVSVGGEAAGLAWRHRRKRPRRRDALSLLNPGVDVSPIASAGPAWQAIARLPGYEDAIRTFAGRRRRYERHTMTDAARGVTTL